MARVLVSRRLPAGGLDPLLDAGHEIVARPDDSPYTPAELRAAVAGCAGLVCLLTDRVDAALLDAGIPTLRVVANVAVGYDNVEVAAATARGVVVCNTPGVLDESTADVAFGLILAACRRASDAEADLRSGRWTGFRFDGFLGRDAQGATLGIVGFGRIGRAVARRAVGFGMTVLHHTRRPTGLPGWCAALDELLVASDVVTLHVPLGPETVHLLDDRRLRLLHSGAVVVNTARGPVVDEEALADALESGRLFAAGLDVYDDEPHVSPRLLAAPHTVLWPHLGSATAATRLAMARTAAINAAAVLAGEEPPNRVSV